MELKSNTEGTQLIHPILHSGGTQMRLLGFGSYPIGASLVMATLAGCGGPAGNGVVPIGSAVPNTFPYHKTFNYTGAAQDFKVPAGVRNLKVVALGAHGAAAGGEALGGRVSAVIPVTPGEVLAVFVGGNGSGSTGGFNGGGGGGTPTSCGDYCGYGGGGASDVRLGTKLNDRIVVAGGGGGKGGNGDGSGGPGGKGGAKTGGAGGMGTGSRYYWPGGAGGSGGSQHHGGAGGAEGYGSTGNGAPGSSGSLGAGGTGGEGCVTVDSRCGAYGANGGGGAGGYYGGGGGAVAGGNDYNQPGGGGGGGGGSSYAEPSATDVHMWQGWKKSAGNGLVVLSWQRE